MAPVTNIRYDAIYPRKGHKRVSNQPPICDQAGPRWLPEHPNVVLIGFKFSQLARSHAQLQVVPKWSLILFRFQRTYCLIALLQNSADLEFQTWVCYRVAECGRVCWSLVCEGRACEGARLGSVPSRPHTRDQVTVRSAHHLRNLTTLLILKRVHVKDPLSTRKEQFFSDNV